jgi:hypothetical protein
MHVFKKLAFFNFAILIPFAGWGTDVIVLDSKEQKAVKMNPTDSFISVVEWIDHYLELEDFQGREVEEQEVKKEMNFNVTISETGITVKPTKKNGSFRYYYAPVSPQEKKEMRYVLTTLAQNSLANIASSKSSLKKAGDRFSHVHPLKFLSVVFTDEELKACIHAIRDRGWIWDEFLNGVIGSLKEETTSQNMRPEFIHDFASVVGINVSLILGAIQEERWKDLINILIDSIPRTNDYNRYNL